MVIEYEEVLRGRVLNGEDNQVTKKLQEWQLREIRNSLQEIIKKKDKNK